MSRLPVKRGISSASVTNIPDTWSAAWFRYFIINFLSNSDVRNSISSPNVLVTGNIDTQATIQSLSGNPPVLFDDGDDVEEPMLIPGAPGASTVSLIGLRTSEATSNNATLTADTQLSLNFTTTGYYALEIYLAFWEAVGTGGFQFDLNSGTALGTMSYGVTGFSSAAITTTVTHIPTVSASSSAPTWVLAKGYVNISTIGTLTLRWAQNTILAPDPTTLKAGSYIMATKIG